MQRSTLFQQPVVLRAIVVLDTLCGPLQAVNDVNSSTCRLVSSWANATTRNTHSGIATVHATRESGIATTRNMHSGIANMQYNF